MIVQAGPADIRRIIAMTHTFNAKHYDKPINWSKFTDWYDLHMNTGVIFMSDAGYISGLVVPDPVRDWDVLAETAWYSEDASGIRLLRAFIKYARQLDLDEVRMCTLNTTPARALALLERMGFEELERSHRLNL